RLFSPESVSLATGQTSENFAANSHQHLDFSRCNPNQLTLETPRPDKPEIKGLFGFVPQNRRFIPLIKRKTCKSRGGCPLLESSNRVIDSIPCRTLFLHSSRFALVLKKTLW